MNEMKPAWPPLATRQTLQARAALLRAIRGFFDARAVLEVETPLLSRHATVDPNIDSYAVADRWLHTSPEFAMKRLLCAGSGDIWQLCKVFRREEAGRQHNPEFSLLEWYRLGFDHHALMDEVEALLRACGAAVDAPRFERLSYREAFVRHAGIDPFALDAPALAAALAARGVPLPQALTAAEREDRDFWLDLWMSLVIAPRLGMDAPCFLFDFPASQAALARVRGEVAERFELIWRGVELANGFHELADAAEQRRRFERDCARREKRGGRAPPYDRWLIEALEAGLPDCAGVALGVDRLLMLMQGVGSIDEVLAFPWDRA